MKLKNSHILLIVMSLFLLVSIGSVCASDAAMDADAKLANDGSITVLSDNSSIVEDTKIDTSVVSENVKINSGETAKIPVTVKDNESQNIDIKSGDLNVTENNKTVKFSYANSSITLTDKLAAGNHSIVIKYLGNANYTASSTKMTLSIVGDTFLNVTNRNVNSTEIVVIPITLTDSVNIYNMDKNNLTLLLSYKNGNDTINKTITDFEFVKNNITFPYTINATTATVNITYVDGNKTYSKKITLTRIYNVALQIINAENEYQTGEFIFKIIDKDTNTAISKQKISLYTVGNIRAGFSTTTDENGTAKFKTSHLYEFDNTNNSFTMKQLEVGKHAVELSMTSPYVLKQNVVLTINKATINIVINPYKEYYQSAEKVVINVTNAKSGEAMSGVILHLNMPATTAKDYYFQTDVNGTAQINVSGLVPNEYKLTVSNNDTKNINKKSVDGTITVLAIKTKMTVTMNTPMYYNTGNTATIKVTDSKTGKVVPGAIVLITITTGKQKQSYLYQANNKGIVTVNYAPAAVGSHKMTVQMADTRYSASTVTKSFTVKKATAKINAGKVTGYYKSGSTFTIKLVNSKNNKPIYGAKLNVKIFISSNRYYNYDGQTALDGKLRISLDTFKPGTYKVVVSKGESKNFTAAQKSSQFVIKKAPLKFTPKKLTAKKGASKYFQITVKNTKTKKVVSAGIPIKVKVYTGKTYKTYTLKTNSKGIAKLNVKSLKVGTHKVVISKGSSYTTAKSATSSIKITKS